MMYYTPKHQSGEVSMPRMTITLSEERQQALKEAAARRGMTITAIIDESLELASCPGITCGRFSKRRGVTLP